MAKCWWHSPIRPVPIFCSGSCQGIFPHNEWCEDGCVELKRRVTKRSAWWIWIYQWGVGVRPVAILYKCGAALLLLHWFIVSRADSKSHLGHAGSSQPSGPSAAAHSCSSAAIWRVRHARVARMKIVRRESFIVDFYLLMVVCRIVSRIFSYLVVLNYYMLCLNRKL